MQLHFHLEVTCADCHTPRSLDELKGNAPTLLRSLRAVRDCNASERETTKEAACPRCGSRRIRVVNGIRRG